MNQMIIDLEPETEIFFNYQSNANHRIGNEIKYSTEVLTSDLNDYNDAYILIGVMFLLQGTL